MPPKNVPVVKMMADAEYTDPSSVTTDLATELSMFMSITDPSIIDKFSDWFR